MMSQTCERWLVPMDPLRWFASETGHRLHYAPGAWAPGAWDRHTYAHARCGTTVARARRMLLGYNYLPCGRCMDHLLNNDRAIKNEIASLKRQTQVLAQAIADLVGPRRR